MDLIELSSVTIFADRMYDQIRGKGWTYHISMSASITEGRYGHQLPHSNPRYNLCNVKYL